MQPRHRLDIRAGDLVSGLAGCLSARDGARPERAVLDRCGLTGRGLVTLSVRSAWDLLLSVLDWPPGTEVIVSAITHPDMITILTAHGLRAVPVDLDPGTLAPALADLEAAVSDRCRAIMVVHLFGGRIDLEPILRCAARHGLRVFEDAAQAFTGPRELGRDRSHVTLYSFGTIKTATAGGGAIMGVRDPELLVELQRRHQSWPVQSRRAYAVRLVKIGGLLLLGWPPVYGAFFRLCVAGGSDPDALVNLVARSFPAAPGRQTAWLARLRRRPAPALTRLLDRRLRRFDAGRLLRRAALGERVTAALPPSVRHPGDRLGSRTHWLYPVVAPDPARLVAQLRGRGLDASRATSNLTAVPGPSGVEPPNASRLMASIVYLPVYPELPEAAVRQLVAGLSV